MATSNQIKALLQSHGTGDDERIYAIALQVAATEGRRGHEALAAEIKKLVDQAKQKKSLPKATPSIFHVAQTAANINPLAMTYGYKRLRFPRPVFIGDPIRTRVTIAEKRDHKRQDSVIVVEKLEVLNQRGECVIACEHLPLANRSAPRP